MENLKATLCRLVESPSDLARGAELLRTHQSAENYHYQLASCSISPQLPLSVRVFSSILLKNSIKSSWDTLTHKQEIKSIILSSSEEPVRRHAVTSKQALSLSEIVDQEYPEVWPEAFETMLDMWCQQPVSSFIDCLIEVIKDKTDQISSAIPLIIPFLWDFHTERHPKVLRALELCVENISWADDEDQELVLAAFSETWNNWFAEFLEVLNSNQERESKISVLRILTVFFREFSNFNLGYFASFKQEALKLLVSSVKDYIREVVYSNSIGLVQEFDDLPGGQEGFATQLLQLLGCFISNELSKEEIQVLVEGVLCYLPITKELEMIWKGDSTMFVLQDETPEVMKNPRFVGLKLISSIVEHSGNESVEIALGVISNIFNQGLEGKLVLLQEEIDPNHQWRFVQSAFMLLGAMSSDISAYNTRVRRLNKEPISLQSIFTPNTIQKATRWKEKLLTGRVYWTTARLGDLIQTDHNQFFQICARGVQKHQDLSVRLTACLALSKLKGKVDSLSYSVEKSLSQLLHDLVCLLQEATQHTLILIIDCLMEVSTLNVSLSSQIPQEASPVVLKLFSKYHKESQLNSKILALIRFWLDLMNCSSPITKCFIPYTASLINTYPISTREKLESNSSTSTADSKMQSESATILPNALELMHYFIKKSKPSDMISLIQLVPPLLQLLSNTSDSSVLLQGTACLRTFCAYAYADLLEVGLEDALVQTAGALLDPVKNEPGALHLGYFIVNIFARVSPRVDEDLLIGCLHKLHRSKMPSIVQGLVLVYARLIHSHSNEILDFLSNQSVDRRVALKVLLDKWLIHQPLIRGRYTKNATITALARLFTLKDQRLESLLVVGYNPSHSNTGSQVLAPFKILCTLIRALNNQSYMPKKQQRMGVNDQFETVVQGSGLGYAGCYEEERMDTIEDESSDQLQDPLDTLKDELLQQISLNYDVQDFEIPESKDKGLGDYETGSECLMSDMLDFDYQEQDDLDEDFFEDDMYSLDDWYGGLSQENFLVDFFKNLIENDKEYLVACMRHLQAEDLALFKKHFSLS